MGERLVEGRQCARGAARLRGRALRQRGLDRGRVGAGPVERLHDRRPDPAVAQEREQEELDRDPRPAVARRGLGRVRKHATRVQVQVFVEFLQVHVQTAPHVRRGRCTPPAEYVRPAPGSVIVANAMRGCPATARSARSHRSGVADDGGPAAVLVVVAGCVAAAMQRRQGNSGVASDHLRTTRKPLRLPSVPRCNRPAARPQSAIGRLPVATVKWAARPPGAATPSTARAGNAAADGRPPRRLRDGPGPPGSRCGLRAAGSAPWWRARRCRRK